MATTTVKPRVTRRRTGAQDADLVLGDAITDLTDAELERDAEQAADTLAALRELITDQTKIMLFRKSDSGQPAWVTTLTPPINAETMYDELKREFGGGKYMARVMANGRIVRVIQFELEGKPRSADTQPDQGGMGQMIPILMRQMESSKSDSMAMMQMMMQQQQASQANNMQMMLAVVGGIAPVLAGLFNKGDTPATMIAALAPFLTREEKGNTMGETLALLSTAKELLGDGSAGGDESFLTTAAKSFMPMLAKGAADLASKQGAPEPEPQRPMPRPLPPALISPPGMSGIPPLPIIPQPFQPPRSPAASGPIDPVLALVGRDVLYFFNRKLPPDLAAEAVLRVMSEEDVPQDAIFALVIRFQTSANWIGDLAEQGIDLRSRPEWAEEFLKELVSQYTDATGDDGNPPREGGGAADPGDDGQFEP